MVIKAADLRPAAVAYTTTVAPGTIFDTTKLPSCPPGGYPYKVGQGRGERYIQAVARRDDGAWQRVALIVDNAAGECGGFVEPDIEWRVRGSRIEFNLEDGLPQALLV